MKTNSYYLHVVLQWTLITFWKRWKQKHKIKWRKVVNCVLGIPILVMTLKCKTFVKNSVFFYWHEVLNVENDFEQFFSLSGKIKHPYIVRVLIESHAIHSVTSKTLLSNVIPAKILNWLQRRRWTKIESKTVRELKKNDCNLNRIYFIVNFSFTFISTHGILLFIHEYYISAYFVH